MTKAIGLIAVAVMFAVGLLIGCQSISDKFWPVHIPTSVPKYIGADVNNIGYPSLEKLKDMSLQVKVFHEHTQAWIDYQSKDDNLTYNSINSITSTIIEQAEKEQQAIFGPGGLASIIITALLAGGGTTAVLRNIWYTETEHQTGIDKAKNSTPA